MPENDAWEVVSAALERKTPKRIPKFILGADWDFMERFYAEVGITYEEFTTYKKDKLPWICPMVLPISVKLGADMTWAGGSNDYIWLDEYQEVGIIYGGRGKAVTRDSTYVPPEGRIKRKIPHIWYNKEGLTTKETIRNYIDKPMKLRIGGYHKLKKLTELCEKKYNLIIANASVAGPWESVHLGIGMANVAKFWKRDRIFLDEIIAYSRDYIIRGANILAKYCKPKVVMIGDDYGFNSGLMMSMEMWRYIVKPTLAEHVKIAHDGGAKFVLHSCGNIGELFKEFVEIGIDGVQSLQPHLNDLPSLKLKYGDKIAFLGTIDDSQMLKYSTPEEVKKSVTQSIKTLGPAGYVPGATNFLLDQPVKNIYAMFEAINNYKI